MAHSFKPTILSQNAANSSNKRDSSEPISQEMPQAMPETEDQEAASIYGGVAEVALPTGRRESVVKFPNTPFPSQLSSPSFPDASSPSWSTAVQSLLDQPPATFPLRFLSVGLVFCVAFGAWTWFGQIEEVGKAQGKLIPAGETFKIQPLEMGKVSRIAVSEGDTVYAGQVLVELDTELAEKEVERLQQILFATQIELNQKQALLKGVELEYKTRAAITAAESHAQLAAIASAQEKAAITRQLLSQRQIESSASQARQTRLKPLLVKAQKRIDQLTTEESLHLQRINRLKSLEEDGAVSQEYIFQAEQALRQTQQQITQSQLQEVTNANEQIFQAAQAQRDLQARITQNKGELLSFLTETQRLRAEQSQKQAEGRAIQLQAQQKLQQLKLDITQSLSKITETKNLLVSAQAKLKYKFLKAPVDGVVLSLNLKRAGEVIGSGKTVAEIAPNGTPLILSAVLPNKDVGFVKIGMPVKVKFDAFPYQDYGVISGKVTHLSSDAKSDKNLGEIYQIEVALARNSVRANQQIIKFKAGQTATADIILRRRRIIEALLDPITKLQKDGINL